MGCAESKVSAPVQSAVPTVPAPPNLSGEAQSLATTLADRSTRSGRHIGGRGASVKVARPAQQPEGVALHTARHEVDAKHRIIFLSDVEGHWEYFCNFVNLCGDRLCFVEPRDHRHDCVTPELALHDDWHLVFGGDACDKGPGSLRFLEAMVQLKKKYPTRVHLVLGNRDINKMRWTSELATSELANFKSVPAAYWVNPKARVTYFEFLRRCAARAEGLDEAEVTETAVEQLNTRANKLRYMLKHDMGSEGDFDFRRQELALMRGVKETEVTDEDVVCSYLDSVAERGCMREYLRLGSLAVLLSGTLFVHGQIIGHFTHCGGSSHQEHWAIGVVPTADGIWPAQVVIDLREWAAQLNAWVHAQVEDWIQRPFWDVPPTEATLESWSNRGGAALLAYGTPATPVPSVVYCRWMDNSNMPREYPPELLDYLRTQGVQRVIVGHTPQGNCPTVIPHKGLTVLMGDTSYSHSSCNVAFQGDNRGDAVSVVFVDNDSMYVVGQTQSKQRIAYTINCSEGGYDNLVGKVQGGSVPQSDRYFVKAKVTQQPGIERDGSAYLMCRVHGFENEYAVLNGDEARSALDGAPIADCAPVLCGVARRGGA